MLLQGSGQFPHPAPDQGKQQSAFTPTENKQGWHHGPSVPFGRKAF